MVLTDWVGRPTYTVNLVAANGCVLASATAQRWPGYNSNLLGGQTVTMPTSESATRVYFLDGDSTVRYLTLDGSTGIAADLPGSATGRVSFSVSPDDTRIAFSVMTWGSTGFREQSYVENLGTGADRIELFTLTGAIAEESIAEEPVGWVNGDVVYGLMPAANEYAPGPDPPAFQAYHVANASTGERIASVCGGSGNAWVFDFGAYSALPTKTGVLCRVGAEYQPFGTLEVVSWSGTALRTVGDAFCATPGAVSPGGIVAIAGTVTVGSPPTQCGSGEFTIKVNDNGATRILAATGFAEGWMDDTHVVIDASTNQSEFPWTYSGPPFPPLKIVDVVSGTTAISAVNGVFAGSVPSGL